MTARIFLSVVLVVFLSSCSRQQKELPPLSRDQMVSVMMEIYLAEARMSMLPLSKDSAYRLFVPHQDSIMRRKGISDSTLRSAYSYYLKRPAELESIYDAIIDSLSLREKRLQEAPHQPVK